MKKKILILTISALLIYLTISIYQKITYNPKKQFLESIKYLSSTNLKNINIEDIKYTSDINIKLKENISKYINLNDTIKDIINKLNNININIQFQKEKNNYELLLSHEDKIKKIIIYDSNIYIIDDDIKNILNINKIINYKNKIEQSIIKNLSYKYFEKEEIEIDEEKVNKITLNLNYENIKELLNNIYQDIKDDIEIDIEKIIKLTPNDLEVNISTYTKENKTIKTEITINNFLNINKIQIELQNNLINIKIDNENIKINLNENVEIFLNDKPIMTLKTKKENDKYKITIESLGLINDIILKNNEGKNNIVLNSKFLEMNLLNLEIEEKGKISNDVKINNPIDN